MSDLPGKIAADEFIRISTLTSFAEGDWNSLLDDSFEFKRRNDNLDYSGGTHVDYQVACEPDKPGEGCDHEPFLNKTQLINYLSDRGDGGPYTKGIWNTQDYQSEIVSYNNTSFKVTMKNDTEVPHDDFDYVEQQNIRYYVKQHIDFEADVNDSNKITELRAYFKPNTTRTEVV